MPFLPELIGTIEPCCQAAYLPAWLEGDEAVTGNVILYTSSVKRFVHKNLSSLQKRIKALLDLGLVCSRDRHMQWSIFLWLLLAQLRFAPGAQDEVSVLMVH